MLWYYIFFNACSVILIPINNLTLVVGLLLYEHAPKNEKKSDGQPSGLFIFIFMQYNAAFINAI